MNAAQAQNQKAIKGARVEQITGAYEMWQKASAGLEIARKSFDRVQNLFNGGFLHLHYTLKFGSAPERPNHNVQISYF